MNETAFYTATMAKVYADQGYFEKSARIYRHLIEREPDRLDFKAALRDVEQKLEAEKNARTRDISALFETWLRLLLKYRNLQKLKKLQNTTLNPIKKRV
ncbi:MAG: hypothetical protein AB1427_05110 [Thermodesulfobacteriota bacterium]